MSRETKAALFAGNKEVFLLLHFVLMFLLKLYNSSAIITVHFFTWQARKKSYVNEKPCTHKSYTEDMIIWR